MVSVIRIKMKEKCSHKWYVTYNSSIIAGDRQALFVKETSQPK